MSCSKRTAPRRTSVLRKLWLEPLEYRITPSLANPFALANPVNPDDAPVLQASPETTVLSPLQISKVVTGGFQDVIRPGDTASFTISVSNVSTEPVTNVVVTDQLPAADLLVWSVTSATFDVAVLSADDFLTASVLSFPAFVTHFVTVSAVVPLDLFGSPFPLPASRLPDGPLELDGNALNNSAVAGDDWADAVFGDGGSALARSFVTDAVNSIHDDVFAGAASKDTQGIQAGPWKFKDSKPQAKNDIAHAFAATYTDPSNGHVILYAGLDRYNSGKSGAGFWFFQDAISLSTADPSPRGSPFTGAHQDGDILLVSDFTQSGQVKVFRWTGDDSTGSLQPVTTPASTTFATVNGESIAVPWSYANKRGQTGPAAGEFLEQAIDLTALDLETCFTSFLAEARSSQSPTATLSDFVIGTFNSCRLDLPNTATLEADDVDPIYSNLALITILHEDAPAGANPEDLGPLPFILASPPAKSRLVPWHGSLASSNADTEHLATLHAVTVERAWRRPEVEAEFSSRKNDEVIEKWKKTKSSDDATPTPEVASRFDLRPFSS